MEQRKLKAEWSFETQKKLHEEFLTPKKFHWSILLNPFDLIDHIKHNLRAKKMKKEFLKVFVEEVRKEVDKEVIENMKRIQEELLAEKQKI